MAVAVAVAVAVALALEVAVALTDGVGGMGGYAKIVVAPPHVR